MVVTANPLERDELPSKVLALKDAVRSFIKPGMVLNLEREANACTAEILRQYVGARPEFTLVIAGVGATLSSLLVHTGLVKKMIFTTTSDFYPAPAPNPVITRAYSQGKLELENWSTLAYTLRLMAGALDVGFMPTKSMLGSSMAEENKDSFTALEDPFGSGRKLGLVKALNPDISVVHGWAADCYGNTITPGFSLTGCWGAKASKQGAVVTVERLVSTRFIREHSHLVRIPGQLVR